MSYFDNVVNRLTIDDLTLLGLLQDLDATMIYKSIKKKTLMEKSKMTEANFRKCICRLIANLFIENVTFKKEHSLYITEFGIMAIHKSMEGVC